MREVQKTCYICNETKPTSEFFRRSGAKSLFRNDCKACCNSRTKKSMQTPEQREKSTERMRRYRSDPVKKERIRALYTERNRKSPNAAFNIMIHNARKRAEINLTTKDLTDLWLKQNKRCAVTGIEMTWSRGRGIEGTSMSLDRIDPSKSYEKSNIRLLCHAVNAFKGRMIDEEMFMMALAIVGNMKRPSLRLVS